MITGEDTNLLRDGKKSRPSLRACLTIYGLGDVREHVSATQVWRAASAGWSRCQVVVVHPLRVPAGHVSLLRQLRRDGEGGRGRRLGAPLAGSGAQLVGCAVAARGRAPAHQGARGNAGRHYFGASADQRTGGDAGRRRVSGQRGAGLAQASLQGGARRRVGGHRAVEGVGAAGDGVDAHDVDLGALRGGGSVRVGEDGAV